MKVYKTNNGDFYIIMAGDLVRQIRARVQGGSDDPLSDREELIHKLCDEIIRLQELRDDE